MSCLDFLSDNGHFNIYSFLLNEGFHTQDGDTFILNKTLGEFTIKLTLDENSIICLILDSSGDESNWSRTYFKSDVFLERYISVIQRIISTCKITN
jgi:hypothetical protein